MSIRKYFTAHLFVKPFIIIPIVNTNNLRQFRTETIYGNIDENAKSTIGQKALCPFRFPGQYEDEETGLFYNRNRYYDPENGCYISQDPIGFHGKNKNTYAYVNDSTTDVDVFGLTVTNTVDFTGHPDLFPAPGGQSNIVTIKLTGDRSSDFTQAFKESGISKADALDYTWHHVADFNPQTGESTMQLVLRSTHEANCPHKGSAGQFQDFFDVKYDTYESKMAAFNAGYRDKPPRKMACS